MKNVIKRNILRFILLTLCSLVVSTGILSTLIFVGDMFYSSILRRGIIHATPFAIDYDTLTDLMFFVPPNDKEFISKYYEYDTERGTDISFYRLIENARVDVIDAHFIKAQSAMWFALQSNPGIPISQMSTEQIDDAVAWANQQPYDEISALALECTESQYAKWGFSTRDLAIGQIRRSIIFILIACAIASIALVFAYRISNKIALTTVLSSREKIFSRTIKKKPMQFSRYSKKQLEHITISATHTAGKLLADTLPFAMIYIFMAIGGAAITLFGYTEVSHQAIWMVYIVAFVPIILLSCAFAFRSHTDNLDKDIGKSIDARMEGVTDIRTLADYQWEEEQIMKKLEKLRKAQSNPDDLLITTALLLIISISVWAFITWQFPLTIIYCMYSLIMVAGAYVLWNSLKKFSIFQQIKIFTPEEEQESIKDYMEIEASSAEGTLEVEDVTLGYDNASEHVLKDINFTASTGEITAIIGASGSGKTALMELVMGFSTPTKGKVRLDGIPVDLMKGEHVRSFIGYVAGTPTLMPKSVRDNLAIAAPNASSFDLRSTLDISMVTDAIMDHRKGISLNLGKVTLTNQENIQLCISRAVARTPKVYILDGCFDQMNQKLASRILRAIKQLPGDKSIIVTCQRVSVAMNADKIIVLDRGECVGIGDHTQLMNSCPCYRQLADVSGGM